MHYGDVDDPEVRTRVSVASVGYRYPHAPIAEAVFDVRVPELVSAQLRELGTFQDQAYTTRQETAFAGAELEVGPLGVTTKAIRRMNGYRFSSIDGLQIVQLRSDGFTFSRLAPYEEWSVFLRRQHGFCGGTAAPHARRS